MCGIGGIWQQDGTQAEHEQLRRMMSAIAHRGPEGSAFARLDGGELLLGFLALAFTELPTTGLQPLFNEDYSTALVYNGEIYDHEALRADLEAKGHRFRTRSDSEVVLHLYDAYGEDMFRHLNGEFAFAIWDGRRRELVLVRDRFGIKPLFYAWHQGALVFASEAKALLSLQGFERALEPAWFAGPGIGIAECAMTPFRGIRAVRPGHVMRVRHDGVDEQPYWRPDLTPLGDVSFEEARDELERRLVRALTRRIGGDVPIALSLSSGVDSATVASLSLETGRKRPCFSISYPGQPYDEGAKASRTAAHLGLDWQGVVCTPESLAEGYLDSMWTTEVVNASLSSVSRMALMRGIREAGHKAVCSGEVSDELFGGYPYFRQEALWRLAQQHHPDAPAALRAFEQQEARSKGIFWSHPKGWREPPGPWGFTSVYQQRARDLQRRLPWMLSRRMYRALEGQTPLDAVQRDLAAFDLSSLDPFNATRMVSRGTFGTFAVPLLGDRVEMSASLEGRVPFQDLEVMELAYRLPQSYCLQPLQAEDKRIVRALSAPRLPSDFEAPRKHNLLSPTFRAFSRTGVGADVVDQLTSMQAVSRAGVLNQVSVQAVKAAWRLHPGGSVAFQRLDRVFGYFMGIQGLHHLFIEGAGLRRPGTSLDLSTDRSPDAALRHG